MKRLVFLAEGNPDGLKDFSGIPHFFARALGKSAASLGIDLEIVRTDYLFNVEELMELLEKLELGLDPAQVIGRDSDIGKDKFCFPANEQLLYELKRCVEGDIATTLLRYYEQVATHLTQRLEELLRPEDALLSQNHFYPYTPCELPIYYFLDASLAHFYFNDEFGSVKPRRRNKQVTAMYTHMEGNVLKSARGIFCFSEALRNDLHQRYRIPCDRLVVAGGGVNLESFPSPSTRTAGPILQLLFVGLDFERKGGRVLLDAMDSLRGQPVQLTIVTSEETVAAGIGSRKNVSLYPPCDKATLSDFYRAADVFVFPTLFEPFGVVLCEAMAFGLPVIASRVNAVPEILGLKDSILLVEPGNAEDLIRAIRYLMDQREIHSSIAVHNYLRARRLFQWKHAANAILSRCLSDFVEERLVTA
jgi:glycosyltransferase involved in cell wall biosynthesis